MRSVPALRLDVNDPGVLHDADSAADLDVLWVAAGTEDLPSERRSRGPSPAACASGAAHRRLQGRHSGGDGAHGGAERAAAAVRACRSSWPPPSCTTSRGRSPGTATPRQHCSSISDTRASRLSCGTTWSSGRPRARTSARRRSSTSPTSSYRTTGSSASTSASLCVLARHAGDAAAVASVRARREEARRVQARVEGVLGRSARHLTGAPCSLPSARLPRPRRPCSYLGGTAIVFRA